MEENEETKSGEPKKLVYHGDSENEGDDNNRVEEDPINQMELRRLSVGMQQRRKTNMVKVEEILARDQTINTTSDGDQVL